MNISIHALLAESDFRGWTLNINGPIFLSTLSLRRATEQSASYNAYLGISIHALLAESDGRIMSALSGLKNFYPRSPCGERRPIAYLNGRPHDFYPRSPCGERLTLQYIKNFSTLFLSTLSLRRATHYGWSWYDDFTISIHALLAESDCTPRSAGPWQAISIHALLAESDYMPFRMPTGGLLFLSTLSLRRATIAWSPDRQARAFLSTLSLRRATVKDAIARSNAQFLSTLSLRRATEVGIPNTNTSKNFYPRSPCGERLILGATTL